MTCRSSRLRRRADSSSPLAAASAPGRRPLSAARRPPPLSPRAFLLGAPARAMAYVFLDVGSRCCRCGGLVYTRLRLSFRPADHPQGGRIFDVRVSQRCA